MFCTEYTKGGVFEICKAIKIRDNEEGIEE